MRAYRLVISRHGRLLGQFESDTPWAEDAIRDLLQRLPGGTAIAPSCSSRTTSAGCSKAARTD